MTQNKILIRARVLCEQQQLGRVVRDYGNLYRKQ